MPDVIDMTDPGWIEQINVPSRYDDHIAGTKEVNVMSFGCGVDSVAGYLLHEEGGGLDDYDMVLWADTGNEHPETYAYFDYLTKTRGWHITKVIPRHGKLLPYLQKYKIMPDWNNRPCTTNFKILPTNAVFRGLFGSKARECVSLYFNSDEKSRTFTESRRKYQRHIFPLVEWEITRERCKQIAAEHGYPVPTKSSCTFCYAHSMNEWRKLKADYPEKYREAVALEELARTTFPDMEPVVPIIQDNTLDAYMPDEEQKTGMDRMVSAPDGGCGCHNVNYGTDEEHDAEMEHVDRLRSCSRS